MPLVDKPEHIKLKGDPRQEPDFTLVDLQALKAVAKGNAGEEQQRRAMQYIINVVAGTYDMSYRTSGTNATMVAIGKQIVGQHLVALIKKSMGKGTGEQP